MTFTVDLPLADEYVDYLGHVTAAAHLTLFEVAHTRWLASVMDDDAPSFVLAHVELDYRRELLQDDGPARVEVRPVRIGRTSVVVAERMCGRDGTLRTESRAVLVRWDRVARRSRVFPDAERVIIEAQLRRE